MLFLHAIVQALGRADSPAPSPRLPRRRPAVIDNARALWEGDHAALAPRATLAGGSFFESVPPADA